MEDREVDGSIVLKWGFIEGVDWIHVAQDRNQTQDLKLRIFGFSE
jgi:hypothetical protein